MNAIEENYEAIFIEEIRKKAGKKGKKEDAKNYAWITRLATTSIGAIIGMAEANDAR